MARRPLPIRPRCRVIVDNDWSGDPDGLLALAHHLLSPANRVVAVTSSFLSPQFSSPVARAADGADLAARLLDEVGVPDRPVVAAGLEGPFDPALERSAAAVEVILTEAQRDDALPLILVCGGPLTNVAAALRRDPSLAQRLSLVWVGGSLAPDAAEYNRDTDPAAAEFVLAHVGLTVDQFPLETYRQCAVTVAELEDGLVEGGPLGRWLWERFTSLYLPEFVHLGEVWPIGDSPPILVTALGLDTSEVGPRSSATSGASVQVMTRVDHRLIWGDFLAKLRRHEHHPVGPST